MLISRIPSSLIFSRRMVRRSCKNGDLLLLNKRLWKQQVAGEILPRLFESMNRLKSYFTRFFHDGPLNWIFILPSAILLALFALPLLALFLRSINEGFFSYA